MQGRVRDRFLWLFLSGTHNFLEKTPGTIQLHVKKKGFTGILEEHLLHNLCRSIHFEYKFITGLKSIHKQLRKNAVSVFCRFWGVFCRFLAKYTSKRAVFFNCLWMDFNAFLDISIKWIILKIIWSKRFSKMSVNSAMDEQLSGTWRTVCYSYWVRLKRD